MSLHRKSPLKGHWPIFVVILLASCLSLLLEPQVQTTTEFTCETGQPCGTCHENPQDGSTLTMNYPAASVGELTRIGLNFKTISQKFGETAGAQLCQVYVKLLGICKLLQGSDGDRDRWNRYTAAEKIARKALKILLFLKKTPSQTGDPNGFLENV